MMMINRAMTVIGLLYFWDVSRGEVETYSIWQDRLEVGHGFAGLDFTETPSQGRIQDSGFSPFREFNLGFQERRMQTGHWSDNDDQSGATSTWWYLSRISLGP
jgi:hypothetical protein